MSLVKIRKAEMATQSDGDSGKTGQFSFFRSPVHQPSDWAAIFAFLLPNEQYLYFHIAVQHSALYITFFNLTVTLRLYNVNSRVYTRPPYWCNNINGRVYTWNETTSITFVISASLCERRLYVGGAATIWRFAIPVWNYVALVTASSNTSSW
jgi:hypothetical protein